MRSFFILLLFTVIVSQSSCYRMRKTAGGGQIKDIPPRILNAADIALPPGYKIEAVAQGFTFPSAAVLDDEGNLYVIETGYSYGEVWGEPKLIQVDKKGMQKVIATGTKNGPWNGLTYYKKNFYVAEGGEMEGGKILKITPDGKISTIISGLPSVGDHHTNGPVIHDGYIYFGQGTATNSAVVGTDNAEFGWLKRKPDFHDVPCKDITLVGENFTTDNVLTDDPDDKATTGAYLPFGTPSTPGQVIKGSVPCNGSIMRVPLEGGKAELVAWGFRNPFGLAVNDKGKLYVTENGYDDRGSRPLWGTADVLWEVENGRWYGWPDFSAGDNMTTDPKDKAKEFKPPTHAKPKAVLRNYPGTPPRPRAIMGVHSSSNGIDFSRSSSFGHVGEAFIAEFGDMAPKVGKVVAPVGFKVVRVDVQSGVIQDFAVNRHSKNGPASWYGGGGLERPVSVKFSPDGKALYIVDFGIMKMTEQGPQPQMKTGVVWKVTKI
ncbi:MAG TPA: PQQ-dependent sugar dehydrogenase [Flavipsychrobacter sp.]|nr:PQQ-dependent sugar dehydrogenase [Flavipsychrobacter sp.]